MPRANRIDIKESAEELRALLRQRASSEVKERIQVLYLYKTGIVTTEQGLAAVVGRSTSTVFRWLQTYRSDGIAGLTRTQRSSGRPADIQGEVLEKLKERLKQPDTFKSYKQIQEWLASECGIDVSYKVVYDTVRYRLKVTLKSTRSRSLTLGVSPFRLTAQRRLGRWPL
ncbi:helix-turn-helix domain-containing protein [Gloeobacter morelensis]|uniref:Helix-turn-helix domain-containing protein n=1 Tax=Gloeobacter morelensis MG652769 TaxID=2781736 RepID=A0ABY3PS68_9CYAN|nr:helix-turn-helix domain-containing protein [Gloeobacter morelensis]UFP96581.1 helix-turn-helix domain-containing protein [Gloeobacter morelensis MG652769]